MPVKNLLIPFSIIDAGDMSGDLSAETSLRYLDNCAIQLIWTGTPTGDFAFDVSNDGLNWSPIQVTSESGTYSAPSAAGSAGNHMIVLNQVPCDKIRVRYIFSAGAGALTAKIIAKEI